MSTLTKTPFRPQALAPAGRRSAIVLVVLGLLLGIGTGAWAYWSTTGTGTGSAVNSTINEATAPSAVVGTGKVTLTWSPVTLSNGVAVDGYRVYRHDSSSATVVCTALSPAHSCDDLSPVGSTVQYGVVAYKGSWTSGESPLTTVTYDSTAPTTTMSVSPAANGAGYNNTDVVVTLVATDAGSGVARVVYTLDGATTTATNSGAGTPFQTQFTVSTEGQHTLTFHAVDQAGNSEPDSTTSTFKIDKTKPAAPTNLAISSDTGSSLSDLVTRSVTQTVSGAAEPNSTVALFKGATRVGTTTASGAGVWSIPNVALTEGNNSFTATATDPADNTSVSSNALAVTLDTQTPAAPVVTQSISSDTGSSTSDRLTKTSLQTLQGTAEANATVTVTRTPASSVTTTADGTGAWSANVALAEGTNTFAVTQTDVAGNGPSSAAGVPAIVLDTVAPTATTNPSGSSSLWRTSQSVVIAALDSGGTAGVASITWSVDGGASTTVNSASTTATVPDGSLRNLAYYAMDKAGNVAGTLTEQYKVDTAAPTTTQGAVTGTLGSNGWYTTNVSFPLNVTDATSGPGSTQWSTASSTGPWTPGTSVSVSTEGSNTVFYQSTDVAGNTGTGQFQVKIDKSPPQVTITDPKSGNVYNNGTTGAAGNRWNKNCNNAEAVCGTVSETTSLLGSITMTLQDTSTQACWTGSGTTYSTAACSTPISVTVTNGNWQVAVPFAVIASRSLNVTVTAKDNAGLTGSKSVSFSAGAS